MQKRTREILALVLLAVFAVIGVSVMGYYILVGHGWNVTASRIDDSIGQMDGYTVVLYEGTQIPEDKAEKASADSGSSPSAAAADPLPETVQANEGGRLRNAASSYQDKGATVFLVDPAELHRYVEPFVVEKAGKRLGFMSVRNNELRSRVNADIRYLQALNVNYIVVVTDDSSLAKLSDEGLVSGLSLIVCDDKMGTFPHNEYHGTAYCVRTPAVGETAAVIISPSGVMSSRTVDET